MPKRIIIHWTGGTNYPNITEKQHYHYLVDKDGKTHYGLFTEADNDNCNDGKYAAHTGGGNTGAIGIALCGMARYDGTHPESTDYPLTAKQFEAAMELCAKLSYKHNLKITPETIMTHYEFGVKHPQTSSAGKIDIIFIPPYPWVSKADVGSFIRSKIKWYIQKLKGQSK